jgi:hypothetical protein
VHTLEEASNVAQFTDTEVNRFFVNLQHAVSALIVASTSLTYEPSTLLGRPGQVDVDDKTTRFGMALSYLPTQHWTVSATFDNDRVKSDDSRELKRTRASALKRAARGNRGVSASANAWTLVGF